MAIDMKKADSYLRELMQKFEKEKDSLEPYVRRLLLKYKDAQVKGEKVMQDLDQLKSQIKQAEARVRSLELQAADIQGKVTGFLDILVSMQFEKEEEVEVAKSGPTMPQMPPTNGAARHQKPSMKKRAADAAAS
jgi:chromosome segregation ATPase